MYISIKLFQSFKLTWMISILQLALNSRVGISLRLCLLVSLSVFPLISSFRFSSLSISSLVCTLSSPFLLLLNKENFIQTFYVMLIYSKCIFHWRLICKEWLVPNSSSCLRSEDCFSLHSSDPGHVHLVMMFCTGAEERLRLGFIFSTISIPHAVNSVHSRVKSPSPFVLDFGFFSSPLHL